MRITSRGFAAVTAGLVSAVVLAGCSSNSTKPTVLPSLLTTPATTSSAAQTPAATSPAPTPSGVASAALSPTTTLASALPATSAAITNPLSATDHAIEQAVRGYYAAVNQAISDPDALVKLRLLFGPGCAQCVSDSTNIANLQNKNWLVTGGTYQIISVKGTATDAHSGGATVAFNVVAATIRNSKGHVVATESAHKGRSAGLSVAMVAGRWKILGYVSFGSAK